MDTTWNAALLVYRVYQSKGSRVTLACLWGSLVWNQLYQLEKMDADHEAYGRRWWPYPQLKICESGVTHRMPSLELAVYPGLPADSKKLALKMMCIYIGFYTWSSCDCWVALQG